MKLSFRLKRVCGNVYSSGNLCFTDSQPGQLPSTTDPLIDSKVKKSNGRDGSVLLSAVGNRITIIDLVQQTSRCLPFENRKDINLLAVSHNGNFAVSVDVEGHALLINLPRQVILSRFHFKRTVISLRFSPDDSHFAVTHNTGCQIWRTPSMRKEFSPLVLSRTIGGFFDECTCLDWSTDSNSLIMGSKDLSCRVFYRVHSKRMAVSVLSGHRDTVLGVFFSEDGSTAYSVAVDGAVFTWQFQQRPRMLLASAGGQEDDEADGSDTETEDLSVEKGAGDVSATKRSSFWQLTAREFLWDPHTTVTCVDFNKQCSLLLVGFSSGVFALYEMPGVVNLHRISISTNQISSVSVNCTGEWLAIGSAKLGQLMVWEWKSESYVLKQQGHLYGLNCMDYSSDGQFIATGGEDGKVKLWNNSSGFCFITFSEHTAPVTGVRFVGKGLGRSIVSASHDGTVRAHDLLRYRNFRTLTAPDPVQFTSLAVDNSGEITCAGALDPFHIYVWSLQTGKLLDVLAGHEGPIACLAFCAETSTLSSGSWDGTLKLWDLFKSTCVDTFEHGCDVLAVAFRPDGREICCATTNGNLNIWNADSGEKIGTIEARRDISGGRLTTDAMSADNAARSKYFTSICYTADGTCILAGGRSKYVCIYVAVTGALIKKFQLSHNRSLEGVLEELRSDRLKDGIALDNLPIDSSEAHLQKNRLPGAGRSHLNDGSRTVRPEVITAELQFSPSGRDWGVVTTQGLQIFSLDESIIFAPTDLDISITPQAVQQAVDEELFTKAINIALHLSERHVLKSAVEAVPMGAIEFVVRTIDLRMAKNLLIYIAEEIIGSRFIEYYLHWCWHMLSSHHNVLTATMSSMSLQECIRGLVRAMTLHEREVMRRSDENHFSLQFLRSQMQLLLRNNEDSAELASPEDRDFALTPANAELLGSNEESNIPPSPPSKKRSGSKSDARQYLEKISPDAEQKSDHSKKDRTAASKSNKKRRVSFSQPLTHEKIISPLGDDDSDSDLVMTSGNVKKQLWADESSKAARKPLNGRKKWLKQQSSDNSSIAAVDVDRTIMESTSTGSGSRKKMQKKNTSSLVNE